MAVGQTDEVPEALFHFDEVTVRFGDRVAIDRVTVQVHDGGVTVLLGPSGSGKSTLLRCCNRLVVPSSGRILLRGRDLAAMDPIGLRRRVGMVFQRPTPFPGTVFDNLRVADPELSRIAATELLGTVALGGSMLDREATELSGGEAQRVCLARTLATGCEVVLADEITSSLDASAAAQVERTVRSLADHGRPVLWVTHDVVQAERLADHELRIEEGRVAD